jgi:hypothetical protein
MSSWRVITVRTEAQGRKERPITDIISGALGNEKWQYPFRLFRINSVKEGAM